MIDSVVIFANKMTILFQAGMARVVTHVMVARRGIGRHGQASLRLIEVGKRLRLGGVDEISTNHDQVGMESVDLTYRLFKAPQVGCVIGKSQLRITHLDKIERLEPRGNDVFTSAERDCRKNQEDEPGTESGQASDSGYRGSQIWR
jgi:hypothetical protein